MLLSIFNFKRKIPHGNWSRLFWLSSLITFLFVGLWESYVRLLGYDATLNSANKDLWAKVRAELEKSDPSRTVIVGSSRIQFDFDLKTYADYFRTQEPIQLALSGSNPIPMLEHIAYKSKASGKVLIGVTPQYFFEAKGGPAAQSRPRQFLEYYQNLTIAQRINFFLWKPLDLHLAFLQEEHFKLNSLIKSLNIPNRPAPNDINSSTSIPYFLRVKSNRRATIWEKMDEQLTTKIQQIWISKQTPALETSDLTDAKFKKTVEANNEDYLEGIAKAVKIIQDRGGKVIFIRLPSSGKLREMENQFFPRSLFWEQILAVTGAKGIHFEDYPELSGFECPEWSHLTEEDSLKFTRNLLHFLEN